MMIQLTGFRSPQLDYFYVKDAQNIYGFGESALVSSEAAKVQANYQFGLRYQSRQVYMWNTYS